MAPQSVYGFIWPLKEVRIRPLLLACHFKNLKNTLSGGIGSKRIDVGYQKADWGHFFLLMSKHFGTFNSMFDSFHSASSAYQNSLVNWT